MKIRKATRKDCVSALVIARELKEWFTPEAIRNMRLDFSVNNLVVAIEDKEVVGFLCYSSEHGLLKILWIGVSKRNHRKGIGGSLLRWLIREAKRIKSKAIQVETLPEEEKYEPYLLTMHFYKKYFFKKLYVKKAIKKGWDDQVVLERKVR